jgi:hypothetical protein
MSEIDLEVGYRIKPKAPPFDAIRLVDVQIPSVRRLPQPIMEIVASSFKYQSQAD